jgi:hypothetical protein
MGRGRVHAVHRMRSALARSSSALKGRAGECLSVFKTDGQARFNALWLTYSLHDPVKPLGRRSPCLGVVDAWRRAWNDSPKGTWRGPRAPLDGARLLHFNKSPSELAPRGLERLKAYVGASREPLQAPSPTPQRPGLQNRWGAWRHVPGRFDSSVLPTLSPSENWRLRLLSHRTQVFACVRTRPFNYVPGDCVPSLPPGPREHACSRCARWPSGSPSPRPRYTPSASEGSSGTFGYRGPSG